jgi:hypothetical protein
MSDKKKKKMIALQNSKRKKGGQNNQQRTRCCGLCKVKVSKVTDADAEGNGDPNGKLLNL